MTWPAAEVFIDEELVRTLIESQYPQFAHLPCRQAGEGFDNSLWRLGEELVVRLPRREVGVEPILRELRWLPVIAGRVTLKTPLPHLPGEATEQYAWPWLIARWVDGVPGDEVSPDDRGRSATALATFLREIHVIAPPDAPANPFRGGPLRDRSSTFEARVLDVTEVVDLSATREIWTRCLKAAPWDTAPLWLHGDLHPGNTLYQDHQLVGVVDFGDLCAGDPATDLAGGLMALPFEALDEFFSTYGPLDDATLWRTVGWATHFGVLMTSLGLLSHPSYLAVGRLSLDNAARLAAAL